MIVNYGNSVGPTDVFSPTDGLGLGFGLGLGLSKRFHDPYDFSRAPSGQNRCRSPGCFSVQRFLSIGRRRAARITFSGRADVRANGCVLRSATIREGNGTWGICCQGRVLRTERGYAQVLKKDHLVGGYEGFRFYDLAKTGDGGKKGKGGGRGSGWNEGFAIAPEWGTNCFPQAGLGSTLAFDPDLFEHTCTTYFQAVQELGRHLFSLIAEGLDLQRDFFEPYLDQQNSFCRLTHYYRSEDSEGGADTKAAEEDTDSEGETEVGAAPHTGSWPVPRLKMSDSLANQPRTQPLDWGALTLLIQDTIGGLQVFDRSKSKWHDVRSATSRAVSVADQVRRFLHCQLVQA